MCQITKSSESPQQSNDEVTLLDSQDLGERKVTHLESILGFEQDERNIENVEQLFLSSNTLDFETREKKMIQETQLVRDAHDKIVKKLEELEVNSIEYDNNDDSDYIKPF